MAADCGGTQSFWRQTCIALEIPSVFIHICTHLHNQLHRTCCRDVTGHTRDSSSWHTHAFQPKKKRRTKWNALLCYTAHLYTGLLYIVFRAHPGFEPFKVAAITTGTMDTVAGMRVFAQTEMQVLHYVLSLFQVSWFLNYFLVLSYKTYGLTLICSLKTQFGNQGPLWILILLSAQQWFTGICSLRTGLKLIHHHYPQKRLTRNQRE